MKVFGLFLAISAQTSREAVLDEILEVAYQTTPSTDNPDGVRPTTTHEVEGHELCRDLVREPLDARRGGVDSHLELVELGDIVDDHHDFTVDHGSRRKLRERWFQLGEIPQEGLAVATVESG